MLINTQIMSNLRSFIHWEMHFNNLNRLKRQSSIFVLSFPFFSPNDLKLIKEKNFYIGDIAVCYQIIKSRSKKTNFFLEFDKMWIHGYLHLLGYKHKKKKDFKKMKKLEDKILNYFYKKIDQQQE